MLPQANPGFNNTTPRTGWLTERADARVQTIRQGFLSKHSSSLRGDWKRRFFVLDSRGMLYYYRRAANHLKILRASCSMLPALGKTCLAVSFPVSKIALRVDLDYWVDGFLVLIIMSESAILQDAKKGLFTDFPPVLQLQLKRFEYDFMRDTSSTRASIISAECTFQIRLDHFLFTDSPCSLTYDGRIGHFYSAGERSEPLTGGCRIEGYVRAKKVPGNLIISARSGANSFDATGMNMSHVIHHLSFSKTVSPLIKYHETKHREIDHQIRELHLHQANRVDNPTVFNVLVDVGRAERSKITTGEGLLHLIEEYRTCWRFSQGSVQTVLSIKKNLRIGRLCGSFDDQIKEFESGAIPHPSSFRFSLFYIHVERDTNCFMYSARQRRALKLKEFIKSGCSYSIVQVDVKNEGIDSFKPDIFGDTIIIERRITDYQLQCFERLSRYPVLVVNVYAPWCIWSTRLLPQTNPGFNNTTLRAGWLTERADARIGFWKNESTVKFLGCCMISKLANADCFEGLNLMMKTKEDMEIVLEERYGGEEVARDDDLAEQIDKDIYFDLMDHDKVNVFKNKKNMLFFKFNKDLTPCLSVSSSLEVGTLREEEIEVRDRR
ncbi:hypothetical protein F3Y22_tig00110187pilonHSYRG00224 [Hibiscus syriacus]|uniref:PH domain-containing protein n=1 Tax=Hibiscus syriacus TaxID=106335 RepID=A0A6A3BGA7_HIBSY|nr:hypothetical protein F3Y22_tig00110187pilonHSYRG00224 [Hibiscus syriacus]